MFCMASSPVVYCNVETQIRNILQALLELLFEVITGWGACPAIFAYLRGDSIVIIYKRSSSNNSNTIFLVVILTYTYLSKVLGLGG